jgi:hypothetical protein
MARQMRGQRAAVAGGPTDTRCWPPISSRRRWRLGRVLSSLDRGWRLLLILQAELQLLGGELLGAAIKLVACQALDQ